MTHFLDESGNIPSLLLPASLNPCTRSWFDNFIFAREQKFVINHSELAICAGMVVTNSKFAPEKILNQSFSP